MLLESFTLSSTWKLAGLTGTPGIGFSVDFLDFLYELEEELLRTTLDRGLLASGFVYDHPETFQGKISILSFRQILRVIRFGICLMPQILQNLTQ